MTHSRNIVKIYNNLTAFNFKLAYHLTYGNLKKKIVNYNFFFFFENQAFIHLIICKESWYKASTVSGSESSTQ